MKTHFSKINFLTATAAVVMGSGAMVWPAAQAKESAPVLPQETRTTPLFEGMGTHSRKVTTSSADA